MQRKWQIGPYEDEQGRLYPLAEQERDREMIHIGWLCDRTGGSAVVAPLRTRDGANFTTVGMAVKFEIGNIPAVDAPQRTAEPTADLLDSAAEDLLDSAPAEPESPPSNEVAESELLPEPALAE